MQSCLTAPVILQNPAIVGSKFLQKCFQKPFSTGLDRLSSYIKLLRQTSNIPAKQVYHKVHKLFCARQPQDVATQKQSERFFREFLRPFTKRLHKVTPQNFFRTTVTDHGARDSCTKHCFLIQKYLQAANVNLYKCLRVLQQDSSLSITLLKANDLAVVH